MKTLALEHANSGKICDWYVQAVAGGIGLYSFFKGFEDLGIESPKILGVQAEICAPVVNAWNAQSPKLLAEHIPKSVIPSEFVRVLRTRDPGKAYETIYRSLVLSKGDMVSVSEEQILDGLRLYYRSSYFKLKYYNMKCLVGLEAAAALAGLKKKTKSGMIKPGSAVLLNVSGAAKSGDINLEWISDLL